MEFKRDENEKIRTLEEICDLSSFCISILGKNYCKLGISKKINCSRQSNFKDNNGFYPCLNFEMFKESEIYEV